MTNPRCWIFLGLLSAFAAPALAQSFRVQCPKSTITHPYAAQNNTEQPYTGPTHLALGPDGYMVPVAATALGAGINGAIKCQQISGGDGYATMADGTQTYMFSFGPLSGLADIAAGKAGTEFPNVFNTSFQGTLMPGDPATADGASDVNGVNSTGYFLGKTPPGTAGAFSYNGAVGLINDLAYISTIFDISESVNTVTVVLNEPSSFKIGDQVVIAGTGTRYDNSLPKSGALPATPASWTVTAINVSNTFFSPQQAFQFTANTSGLAEVNEPANATAASLPGITGHVDPRPIIDVGVMNGNIPAPLIAFDEDDEFFLTLSNVGMIMRPDLFEQHTVHFHGYPNASSFYDGVPDASVAIDIGGSFTYYYLAPDAGTYFWHCHITPPEHLQMGMVGQLYVRPRQNRVAAGGSLLHALQLQNGQVTGQMIDLRTVCNPTTDTLCSTVTPPTTNNAMRAAKGTLCSGVAPSGYTGTPLYAYNDGDGSTCYDTEYPLQIHGFDPNFHFVGMTFNPEGFVDMKDKYFLLNGRSYPDTVNPDVQMTQSSDGRAHYSQPLPSIINIPAGGRALLRIADLSVSEYATLTSLGIPMHVIGYNAKLLRDQAGNNTDYYTNSITLGGGESLDVILDASDTTKYQSGQVFYLYTPQLDHLSNDAENFGGLMTEVHIL